MTFLTCGVLGSDAVVFREPFDGLSLPTAGRLGEHQLMFRPRDSCDQAPRCVAQHRSRAAGRSLDT
jgi:hypothetical protein